MTRSYLLLLLILSGLIACHRAHPNAPKAQAMTHQTTPISKNYVSIFEIPATDISRAIRFYQAILDVSIERFEMPGMKMGVLPVENQLVIGTLVEGEGHQPSQSGVTIYLNGGNNLQVILDKVSKNGGSLLAPKTPHADESGYFALFLDSEGNKIGLHSPN